MSRNVFLFFCLTAASALAASAFSQSLLSQYKGVPTTTAAIKASPMHSLSSVQAQHCHCRGTPERQAIQK
jgi:hypothetical protein